MAKNSKGRKKSREETICLLLVMKDEAIISNLHLKFAEKTWNETFRLVRRCMVRHVPVKLHLIVHYL